MQKNLISLSQALQTEAKDPRDLYDTLKRIATTAQKYFSANLCVIFPLNPITGNFLREPPTLVGKFTNSKTDDFQYPRKEGVTRKILKNRILPVEKLSKEYTNPIVRAEKIKSFIGIGLYTNNYQKPLAVMYIDYKRSKKFSREFVNNLTLFADIASSELQATWFVRRYREIARIGQDINENFENIDRMFEKVVEHIKGILDVSYYFSMVNYDLRRNEAELYLVDEGKKDIKKNFELANSVSSWVLRSLKTTMFNNLYREKLPEGVQAVHIDGTASREKSSIFVPIKINDKPLGVLSVQHHKSRYFDEEDKQILELLANHIALALNNSRLLDDLQQLDKSGQILTDKLDSIEDIVPDVVDHIYGTTQADLITLYPYIKSDDRYLPPIHKGDFREPGSLKKGEATTDAIVHLVNFHDKPVFAEDSTNLYSSFGKDYHRGGQFPQREGVRSTVAMPLKAGTEPIGVLFINYRSRQQFDRAQKWVINSLASYAAIAIRNSRRMQDLRLRRLKELEDLRQIDREISQILDRDKILRTILKLTTKHIKADTGVILLHNKKLNAIEAKVSIGENLPPLEQQIYPLDQLQGIAKSAFNNKKPIRINNVRQDVEWKDRYTEISSTTVSEMDVPLILGDEAIGVMNFESSRESAFSQEDENFMETLAGQAVIAIKNAIEYERAQRIAKEREALIEIVNTLLEQTNQKKIFNIILKKALEITETIKGTINTCDEDRREIRVAAYMGLKEGWETRVQTFDEGIIGRVARKKQLIKIDKLSIDPLRAEFLDAFPGTEESELAVPILDGDKLVGIINLESENPYHFEDDDVELIKSLASLCAVAIKNAENISQKQLAYVGTITGDLSHKINSPLAKIQKQVELVELKHKEDLERNSYLAEKMAQITTITSNTIQMVQRRLDEAKRNFTTLERTSVPFMLQRALMEVEIPEEIELINSIDDPKKPLYVFATPELANIFQNLLTNAIRAIMPKTGKIFINLEKEDKDWVIISVEDTGVGIPDSVAPLVYLPISDKGLGGHGVGLPMTKAYIEMIGGMIENPVRGREGVGAKFIIHLRRA